MTLISLLSPRGQGKGAIDRLKKLKPAKGILCRTSMLRSGAMMPWFYMTQPTSIEL